jgi:antitoxin HigA-1
MSTTANITRVPGTMMHNPPHPGVVLRDGWITPLDLTVSSVADALVVSRKTLSAILNTHAGISSDMALRLARALGTTAEFWLTLQLHYDLWQAQQHRTVRVSPLPLPRAARAHLRHSAGKPRARVAARPRRAKTRVR